MFWFKKKKAVEPVTSSRGVSGSSGKMQPLSQDRHILYSLGTVNRVKPSERFDIRGEQEGYFLVTQGTANLQMDGAVDIKPVGEGQWISTSLLPKSGKHFLSLKSAKEFKVLHFARASVEGIGTGTKAQIDTSTRELSKYINKSLSGMDSLEQSIGEYVRSSLRQRNRSILSQYDSSKFINRALNEISSLPTVAQKFIGLTTSDSVSNADIAAYIRNNPSLASEVLKVVNSCYHGLRNKVNDINYAVLYLGLTQIFQIVVSASLQSIVSKSNEMLSVHEHSMILSNVVGLLSVPRERRTSPIFTTVGILHDVGEIVKFHIKEKHKNMEFLVDQLSGAKLGSMLLENWGIPETICRAIEIHDESEYTLPEEIDDAVRPYVACLHVGHKVCSFIKDESVPFDPITRAYMSFLGFEGMNIEQLIRLYIVPELRNIVDKLPVEVQVFFSV
jgi:HD-like signal output (HDOD) protein